MVREPLDPSPASLLVESDAPSSSATSGDLIRTPSRWLIGGLAAVMIGLAFWLIGSSVERASTPPEPITPTTRSSDVPTTIDERPAGNVAADGVAAWNLESPLLIGPTSLLVAERVDGELLLWAVDLGAGQARPVDLSSVLDSASIVDVRFFPGGRLIADDVEGRYHLLRVEGDQLMLDRVVDVGRERMLGSRGLGPDGELAWVVFDGGLIRWHLDDDEVDRRWIDRFGDRTSIPEVRGVVESGLVVQGSARTFLVTGSEVEPLDLDGDVVATAGDWLVVRNCDDQMRCGRLDLVDVGERATVSLSPDYRFRVGCGLAFPGHDARTLHVLAERLGTLVLLTVGPNGVLAETDLHPAGVGCVDAFALSERLVVVGHQRAVTLVDLGVGAEPAVELVHLAGLRQAVGLGPAGD